eukprot:CFRG1126T1
MRLITRLKLLSIRLSDDNPTSYLSCNVFTMRSASRWLSNIYLRGLLILLIASVSFTNAIEEDNDVHSEATGNHKATTKHASKLKGENDIKSTASQTEYFNRPKSSDQVIILVKDNEKIGENFLVTDDDGTVLMIKQIDFETTNLYGTLEQIKDEVESKLNSDLHKSGVNEANGISEGIEGDVEYKQLMRDTQTTVLAFGERGFVKDNGYIDLESSVPILRTNISSDLRFYVQFGVDALRSTKKCSESYRPGNLKGDLVTCCLPSTMNVDKMSDGKLTKHNPVQLLSPLTGELLNYSDGFWSYTLQVGTHLKQYLMVKGKDGKEVVRHDYILGKFIEPPSEDKQEYKNMLHSKVGFDKQHKHSKDELPLLEWAGLRFPYMELIYTEGTMCDITGMPRKTFVRFICLQVAPTSLLVSVEELSTCVYAVIVATPLLCTDRRFQVISKNRYSIECSLHFGQSSYDTLRHAVSQRESLISHITNWGLPETMPNTWKDPLTAMQRGVGAEHSTFQYNKLRDELISGILSERTRAKLDERLEEP